MKNKIIFILILLLAFFLRFWQLGINPPSLDWDEASLGYNAYSILETMKDEYGNYLPLSIRSFGDYKPPLYTYLTIIPVAILGLNEFSVRFISALFGVLTVLVSYLLIKELFPKKPTIFHLLFCILFAVSPWHLQFSRVAFEASLGLFFILSGVWLFLRGLANNKYFLLAAVSFALSMYSYHSPRLIVPLILIGLMFIFRDKIRFNLKWLLTSFVLGLFIVLPLIYQLGTSTGARFNSVTIMNPFERLGESIESIEFDQTRGDLPGKVMHNRRIVYAKEILAGYLDHFNFDFLFLTGDPPGRHHASGMGMLYLWELPFILIGFFHVLKRPEKEYKVVIWWFLVAPVASALTTGTPHAVRAIYFLPLYQIFCALGVVELIRLIDNRLPLYKNWILFFVFALFITNFFYYIHMYWIHTPVEYSRDWQYGYKQVVEATRRLEDVYSKVIVTYSYDQPYIYFLFYNKVSPLWHQQAVGNGEIARAKRSFGKYEFRNIDWTSDSQKVNTLLVGTPEEIPSNIPGIIQEILFLDGTVAFRIVER